MVTQIRAAHYMIFSISAFALFILMSYYASTNTVTTQLHSHLAKGLHHHHHSMSSNSTHEPNGANLELNSSQPNGDLDSISSIIFKNLVNQSTGGVNGTYYQYLVNQSQAEMGIVNIEPLKYANLNTTSTSTTSTSTTTTTTTVVPILPVKKSSPAANSSPDSTKAITTRDLYESGHIDPPQICANDGEDIRLVIIITSAPAHVQARLAIRQTWGHFGTRRDIGIAFLIGQVSGGGGQMDDELDAEMKLYDDIIRGRFIDNYTNLTLKTISMLEWVDTYCSKASFILKTDDDMFINVPKLIQFIEKKQSDKRTIYGRLAKKWKPIRNKKSKYYVSLEQYKPAIFPQFTTGPAYLLTRDCIKDLYNKALNETYLKLEDVYMTGIVAQAVGIKRVHVNEFLNRRIAFNACNIKKAVSLHMIKPPEEIDLWKKLLDTSVKCK